MFFIEICVTTYITGLTIGRFLTLANFIGSAFA